MPAKKSALRLTAPVDNGTLACVCAECQTKIISLRKKLRCAKVKVVGKNENFEVYLTDHFSVNIEMV